MRREQMYIFLKAYTDPLYKLKQQETTFNICSGIANH